MAPFPFLHRATLSEYARHLSLSGYRPEIHLRDLAIGVDNLRHDVFLSAKFTELARTHLSLLVGYHGGVQHLLLPSIENTSSETVSAPTAVRLTDTALEFKKRTTELQVAGLTYARQQSNLYVDLLLRLSLVKFYREELNAQFTQAQERCRSKLRAMETPTNATVVIQLKDQFARFQINKRSVLRKCGEDIYATLREIEKETIGHMRRSIFGDSEGAAYDLFLNRLVFTDEGRDDFLKAEHYVMLGNFDRDLDRLDFVSELVRNFFAAVLPVGSYGAGAEELDDLLNVPENAQELLGGGVPEESSEKGKAQRALLFAWLGKLEEANVMEHVVAAYAVAPLLAEYCPLINPQQLKIALISRAESERVEQLLAGQGKISPANFHAAGRRVFNYTRAERAKIAGRFLIDFLRYRRDLRRLEALNTGIELVNLITSERMRQLSAVNSTLHEFLLPEEQKPADTRVVSHAVLKADVRDSTKLTHNLAERGQNPASYFSLGFYGPVSKLLPKFAATKIFIEGDAIILGIEEREGTPAFPVARACALACEITSIVHAFHQRSRSMQLPALELGIGISFQDSAPMYLLDGDSRIMISEALNSADRFASCSRRARGHMEKHKLPFHVFQFEALADDGDPAEKFLLQYNVGGIQLSPAAFQRLRREISLQEFEIAFPGIWDEQPVRFYRGLVPIPEVFSTLVVREALVPLIDARDFSLRAWTDQKYYELCTTQEVHDAVEQAHTRSVTV